jgi:arabinose-5-phosphate isomerase
MVSLYAVREALGVAENAPEQEEEIEAFARDSFEHQAAAIATLASRIGRDFHCALSLILGCSGRLVVSGVGKSGLIAQKIAATFSSTGTPSFFLHPTEALHGDLGMVCAGDLALLISNSGETEEIMRLLPALRARQVRIIALVGDLKSTIGQRVDVALDVSVDREVCPLNLVPTTSVLAAHAMGDALAISAMRGRNFAAHDFAQLHPAGHLGKRLLCRVRDAMRRHHLPFVTPAETLRECVMTMTRGRAGLAIVMDGRKLSGIVTDGDVRRALQRPDALQAKVSEIMTESPVTIGEDASLAEAEERMHRLRLKALIVLNSSQEVVGLVEIFDG